MTAPAFEQVNLRGVESAADSARRAKLEQASRLCTEIGLETFGRRPHEMTATSLEWKFQRAKAMVREIGKLVEDALP
jgi:hypothetical protein